MKKGFDYEIVGHGISGSLASATIGATVTPFGTDALIDTCCFRDNRVVDYEVTNMSTLDYALKANEDQSPVSVLLVVSGDNFRRENVQVLIESFNTVTSVFP